MGWGGWIAELWSSRERPFGSARSHFILRTRLHQVGISVFRFHESCERSRNLKIATPVYAGHRRSISSLDMCILHDACITLVSAIQSLDMCILHDVCIA